MARILVVDDEQEMRIAIFETLSREGYNVSVAENGQTALDILAKNPADMIFSDIKMPEVDGIELLRRVRLNHPNIPLVFITGFATVDTAVEAMKLGAEDYILKPCPAQVVRETAARVLRESKARQGEVAVAMPVGASGVGKKNGVQKEVIGQDPAWLNVTKKAKAVASSMATVLVLGESGTGKEVLARLIHTASDRAGGPFLALNCAALPDGLLESELFGHEKGAFTGAVSMKKGKFELAHGGTLLLDEIGEIPLHLQAKLLRVLQEEEVDRLGGRAPVKFNVHVVATTNRDLSEAVDKGEFRQDLFYRLNVIPLKLPALRERKSDIPILAQHFIEKFSSRYNQKVKPLSGASAQRLLSYAWPGNVREMENMFERAVLLSDGEALEPWDLWDEQEPAAGAAPASAGGAPAASGSDFSFAEGPDGMTPLREVERQMIMHALRKTDNNRTHAAKMLGISVRTLRNKLNEYRSQGFIE